MKLSKRPDNPNGIDDFVTRQVARILRDARADALKDIHDRQHCPSSPSPQLDVPVGESTSAHLRQLTEPKSSKTGHPF